MTTSKYRPTHYKPVAFTNGTSCGVQTRHGVNYSLRMESVTCPRCIKEMLKPATTVEEALKRVSHYAHHTLGNDPEATHRLLDTLNALVPTPTKENS